jgi:hypothetical protein
MEHMPIAVQVTEDHDRMDHLEFWLWLLAVAGLTIGGWSVCWARREDGRAWWGRKVFVATILVLGASGLVGALVLADGTITLGLLAGFLLIAMLWETPILLSAKKE